MIIITKYFLGFSLCGTTPDFTLLISLKASQPDGRHDRGRDSAFHFVFLYSSFFKMVPIYACAAPAHLPCLMPPSVFPFLTFIPSPAQAGRFSLSQNFLWPRFPAMVLLSQYPSQLQKIFLLSGCSFRFILVQQINDKVLRVRSWGFNLYILSQPFREGISGKESCTPGAHCLAQGNLWDEGMAVM